MIKYDHIKETKMSTGVEDFLSCFDGPDGPERLKEFIQAVAEVNKRREEKLKEKLKQEERRRKILELGNWELDLFLNVLKYIWLVYLIVIPVFYFFNSPFDVIGYITVGFSFISIVVGIVLLGA